MNTRITNEKDLIFTDIASCCGSEEKSRVYMVTHVKSGETELVIEKTIMERYPVTDLKKVIKLHDDLNRGGGRRLWKLKDLTK